MELWIILCVIPTFVTTITISPNGNSPETKMIGGMMVDAQKRNTETIVKHETLQRNTITTNKVLQANSSQLAINERYRRLIPYMTFYYANDLVTPTTESYDSDNNVQVEKAKIVEAGTIIPTERQPKIIYTPQRFKNVPIYQGNRLTKFNIASSNPNKFFYKDFVPVVYQNPSKIKTTHPPELSEQNVYDRDVTYDYYIPKQIKAPSAPFSAPPRKPFLNLYQNEDYLPNVQYFSEPERPKYKLIPYEQTPPIQSSNILSSKQHYSLPAIAQKEPIYIKTRPSLRPQPFYVNQQLQSRKPPATITENYYERRKPVSVLVEPVVESGFKPILSSAESTEVPQTQDEVQVHFQNLKTDKEQQLHVIESETITPEDATSKPQYSIEQATYEQTPYKQSQNSVTLAELLNSLQINKSIPKPITRENVSASIRTLLQVLNTLKATNMQNEVEAAAVSTPKSLENSEIPLKTPSQIPSTTSPPQEFYEEPYLAPIHTPSQHLDDYPTGGGTSQRFPLPVTSDEEGGTPGHPGIDYPILTVIPPTKFNCKTQRYKGFFADPETRCQVWHYCDLNGGQASFLCPNGTIFSQAALTCDWWFNVKCASTAQLYVLNESLYKYILPHSPKFPEDYSGPLVDKYLTLKFKEMEEQFKKNKNKKVASEKLDSDEESTSTETTEKDSPTEGSSGIDKTLVNQADVIVESSGNSGNVQRLQNE